MFPTYFASKVNRYGKVSLQAFHRILVCKIWSYETLDIKYLVKKILLIRLNLDSTQKYIFANNQLWVFKKTHENTTKFESINFHARGLNGGFIPKQI